MNNMVHKTKSDSKAAVATGTMHSNLRKKVEYVRQILRGYTDERPAPCKKGPRGNVTGGIV
jgi:hypothetical protein